MNVDRLPDIGDDPDRAPETARLTETPQPEETAPAETLRPSPPEPAPERKPTPDQQPRAEREPEPDREQPPEPAPTNSPTDSPAAPPETAEPRSRQEHADLPLLDTSSNHVNQDQTPPDDAGAGEDRQALTPIEDEPQRDEIEWEIPDEKQSGRQLEEQRSRESTGHDEGAKQAQLTDHADFPTRPLTNQEHTEREADVFDELTKAHGAELATDYQYTTDPDRQQWTPQRDAIHGEIVRDLYERASEVPCEYKAIIVGGLGGAGKTTILTQNAGIDLSHYLIVNPDDIKEEMARRGLVPEIEGLTPMEASDLVHEESSAVAKQLARRAQSEGKNLIWDITMSSEASTQQRIDDLRSAGYTQVDGIFVEISIDTSIRRTEFRHREGHDNYRAGIGLGGRFVPPEVIRRQADPDWGCKNRKTFEKMKTGLNNWEIHDNSVDDRSAILIETNKQKNIGLARQERRES